MMQGVYYINFIKQTRILLFKSSCLDVLLATDTSLSLWPGLHHPSIIIIVNQYTYTAVLLTFLAPDVAPVDHKGESYTV